MILHQLFVIKSVWLKYNPTTEEMRTTREVMLQEVDKKIEEIILLHKHIDENFYE